MRDPTGGGGAAAVAGRNPHPGDLKARLMKTARKQWQSDGTKPDIFSRRAGYLNIPAALACTTRVRGAACSPQAARQSNGTLVIAADPRLGTNQALWGDQALWADQALWGDNVVWGDQALWGDNALGGD